MEAIVLLVNRRHQGLLCASESKELVLDRAAAAPLAVVT